MVTLYRPNSLFRDFNRVANQINNFGRGAASPMTAIAASGLGIDWKVEDDQVVISAELPGVDPEEINISLEKGNRLTIAGERKIVSNDDDEDVTFIRRERRFGSFSRSMQLPFNIAEDGVEATYSNGILTISLARAEADKPRQIAVKSS